MWIKSLAHWKKAPGRPLRLNEAPSARLLSTGKRGEYRSMSRLMERHHGQQTIQRLERVLEPQRLIIVTIRSCIESSTQQKLALPERVVYSSVQCVSHGHPSAAMKAGARCVGRAPEKPLGGG